MCCRSRFFLCAVFSATLCAGRALAVDCAQPSVAEVEQLHDRWAQSLTTIHPDKVLRNYAPDATLIGLDAAELLADDIAIRNYYVYFLQREAKPRFENRVVHTGCDTASEVGTMTLSIRPKAKAPAEPLPVRYSINYERRGDKWLIVHHHLSVMEHPASPASKPVVMAPPPARKPEVAGFIKRAATSRPRKQVPTSAAPGGDGSDYMPGTWRNGSPVFQGD